MAVAIWKLRSGETFIQYKDLETGLHYFKEPNLITDKFIMSVIRIDLIKPKES